MGDAPTRNEGGIALGRLGKTRQAIADECGVSKPTAHDWITCAKKPAVPMREKLFDIYGIPTDAWDEAAEVTKPFAATTTEPRESKPRATSSGNGDDVVSMAQSIQRLAKADIDRLSDPGTASTPAERAQVFQRLGSTLTALNRITGSRAMAQRILHLPIWRQLETELFEALKPYPEASRAVAERLRKFEARWLVENE